MSFLVAECLLLEFYLINSFSSASWAFYPLGLKSMLRSFRFFKWLFLGFFLLFQLVFILSYFLFFVKLVKSFILFILVFFGSKKKRQNTTVDVDFEIRFESLKCRGMLRRRLRSRPRHRCNCWNVCHTHTYSRYFFCFWGGLALVVFGLSLHVLLCAKVLMSPQCICVCVCDLAYVCVNVILML